MDCSTSPHSLSVGPRGDGAYLGGSLFASLTHGGVGINYSVELLMVADKYCTVDAFGFAVY